MTEHPQVTCSIFNKSSDAVPDTGGSIEMYVVDAGVQYNLIIALAETETEVFKTISRINGLNLPLLPGL